MKKKTKLWVYGSTVAFVVLELGSAFTPDFPGKVGIVLVLGLVVGSSWILAMGQMRFERQMDRDKGDVRS